MSATSNLRDARYVPADIGLAVAQGRFPTVLMWNRLEARPRTHDFDRALKAEVRDALWMLTKQWQMGEFKADDAGSPVFAKIHIKSSRLDTYRAAGRAAQAFEENVPLETKVEQKKIPFVRGGREISVDIRLEMGYRWLKMLAKEGLDFRGAYIATYPFVLPANDRGADDIYAHKEVWQQYEAVSGRSVDGYKLYQHLVATGSRASDGITNADPAMSALDGLGVTFKDWVSSAYYQPEDEKNNAWLPERLEYAFECSSTAETEQTLIKAEEYYQGNLDWYAFDISRRQADDPGQQKRPHTSTFIPAHVQFEGMPDTRWWKFEDGKTSLSDIKPSTTDLSKLLLVEFGLVFANDWFLLPYVLPVGSLANVEGLTVSNNFGETIWIEPAEEAGSDDTVWSMFKLASERQDNTLLLAPSAMKVHEGEPLEEIVLIRDEMSNMVWGIETRVPGALGVGRRGSEVAGETRQFHERFVLIDLIGAQADFYINIIDTIPGLSGGINSATPEIQAAIYNLLVALPGLPANLQLVAEALGETKRTFEKIKLEIDSGRPDVNTLKQDLDKTIKGLYDRVEERASLAFANAADKTLLNDFLKLTARLKTNGYAAAVSYQAMTDVPENWIPFVPVHTAGSNREIQLQRASMLRIIEGDIADPVKIKPQTDTLRHGLEDAPGANAYYIHEEEVPRAGVRVIQSFQRTRWVNGEVFVWLGTKKKTGRGEGSSGLAFDQIKESGIKSS
jgi:hypothetical protein